MKRFRNPAEKWQFSTGMNGNFAPEQVATFNRNLWHFYSGICNMRIREVPDELHKKFKLLCVKKNISMNKYLIQMIKKEVEKEDRKDA